MTEAAYERGWRNITKVPYKEFGRPLSCNILWQKATGQHDSINPNSQNKKAIAVATSIAPKEIEKQQTAIRTWLSNGLQVISVNTGAEISLLAGYFPEVTFIEATRDARETMGRPLIFLDDVLAALATLGAPICGIINSDIYLDVKFKLADYIAREAVSSLIIGHRIDVDKLGSTDGEVYLNGFDLFFLIATCVMLFHLTIFALAQPGGIHGCH